MIISRTPLRITLCGGGTDLPSYYSKNNGLVLSMAIDKYIYLTYKPDLFSKKLTLRYSEIENVTHVNQLKNHRARQVLLNHNIINSCEINSCADIPSNTGLGSSGSFIVGLLNCVKEYQKTNNNPSILAEEACDIEINQLKEPVGKQDQYIASFGGIKILNINTNGKVNVEDFNINKDILSKLISNFCVYYLNIRRDASDILHQQQQNMQSNKLLDFIKQHACKSIKLLKDGEIDKYGILLDEYWEIKKQLSNKISSNSIDSLYEKVKKEYNVLGGKVIGAGGGGFLLLYCSSNQEKLNKFMENNNFLRLYFNIDYKGSTILGNFTQ